MSTSIKVAGDDFDEAIVRYMRKKHNLLIGERTAEDIKIKIGTTYPIDVKMRVMEVRGRNLVTGLPKDCYGNFRRRQEKHLRETTGQIVEAVYQRVGENSAGAFSRYSGQRNCADGRRINAAWSGRADRRKDRY